MFQIVSKKERERVAALFSAYFDSPFVGEEWQEWLAKETVTVAVARQGEEEIGIIIGEQVADEGEIMEVAVLPECRRQGVGGKLLRYFLEEMQAQGVERIFLEVRVGNAAARALYAKAGFAEIGIRKKYYKDGEDAVQMRIDYAET